MKRYVMIGAPVTAVRTPALLGAFLSEIGVEAEIEARHVEPEGLDACMTAVRADPSVDGLLVTMPHKRSIIPHLASISAVARRSGSVNAVKRVATGALVGAQFDGVALVNALTSAGVPIASARILLAGIGGAGLAIAQAILAHGCGELAIVDLNAGLLAATLEDLGRLGPVSARRDSDTGTFDLLINATPLGMRDGDPSPFPYETVARASSVADIVADPPRTRLADDARRVGATLITGRDMVRGQVAPIGRWLLEPGLEQ